MNAPVLGLIFASAGTTAIANIMLRRGVLDAGSPSMAPAHLKNSLLALAHQPMFVVGVILYGLAALIWFQVLSMAPLSISYPVLVALTFLLVTAGAIMTFHESVTVQKIAGILVILAGIIMVSRA
jgi:multidrug transporter EmrE-like cation transporter